MRLLAAVVLVLTLGLTSNASARIAIEPIRRILRGAAEVAAQCDGAIPGAYRLRITLGDGPARAELTADPGLADEARACVERAFEAPPYPDARHGTIHVNYPMTIVAPP